MFNKLLILVFSLFIFNSIEAQLKDLATAGYENGTNQNVIYKHDVSGKAYIHTRGVGILFRQSKHVTAKTRSFYEVDIQSIKHPKEIKVTSANTFNNEKRRFVYGKLNNVLFLRGALGLQNVLFTKADNKSVEIRYSYSIGPLLALAKPYYVKVFTNNSRGINDIDYVKFNSENFNTNTPILGRAGFLKGFSEMKYYPAITAKFNMSFEYAPYSNLIRALETGISVDYFPKALPLMHLNHAENLIFTIHLGFVFGTKWY